MKLSGSKTRTLILTMALLLSVPLSVGCGSKQEEPQVPQETQEAQEARAAVEAYDAAASQFNEAVAALEEKNTALDTAILDLKVLMGSEVSPLDATTLDTAETAIGAAESAKVSAPEMAKDTEAILVQVNEIKAVDYTEQLNGLTQASSALKDSIRQHEQVINPSKEFVIERLSKVEHIQYPTAVTEKNDPNGKLGKEDGYTAAIFFLSDLVNQNLTLGMDPVRIGTKGGGAVEVFASEEGATKRNEYLTSFDGGWLSSGSHRVFGTCVIRTSENLSAEQQGELEGAIIDALTSLE